MMKCTILGFVLGCSLATARQNTGHPTGLFADCPGMNRSTTLSKNTKRSLTIMVFWPTSSIFESNEKICHLSRDGAACVADVLDLKRRKTQVIITGYLDASFSPFVQMILEPYLKLDRNIIVVEVFPILMQSYPISARLTKPFGYLIGELLSELTYKGLSPKQLELIGVSLGAHIASFAAMRYHQLTNKKPMRLTGLDPAGPCFRNLDPQYRFNSNAAHKVDALHTNIDGFGIADAVAQVDFYANGGEYQQAMANGILLPCFTVCSHYRAVTYWVAALSNPDKFLSIRCNSVQEVRYGDCYDDRLQTNVLGLNTNFTRPGIYYLPTKETHPFYIAEEALKKRPLGFNSYLLKVTPDEDIIL